MALRPKAFSIPSSTQLKITFTANLSLNLGLDNFEIESLNGAVSNLAVLGVEIEDNVVILKTQPQVAGNYYLLKLLDTKSSLFISEKGERLVDDSVSRELFFVGIDNINPIRDQIFEKVPGLFSLENSNLKNILSAQAEEIYSAQKKIGELLSDNYISIDVKDEFRVRGPGATDRLANEQAYDITRISRYPTNSRAKFDTLSYTKDNSFERLSSLPTYPISLQQSLVEDEEVSYESNNNDYNGFLITVSKNIIKLLSLTLIKDSDIMDCHGNVGSEYNIEKYKYAIADNFYDQDFAFKHSQLANNQILLSEFGNVTSFEPGDKVIVSYLTKDASRVVLEDSINVSRVESKTSEPIPTNSYRFFLSKAPIVNSENEIPSKNGVKFQISENDSTTPEEFKKEIPFNTSKLPSLPGEYSINYATGEVFLVGNSNKKGTERNNYIANYLYRKEFIRNLDFSISDQNLVANPRRNLGGSEAEISFNYDVVFAKDIDYKFNSHIEVMGEQVENRINNSFSLETKHSPITNVYRIYNQTTGEVYNPLYHTKTEIFFSGNRSPEIRTVELEPAKFKKISNDKLEIVGELVLPVFEVKITSNATNNNIQFSPKIPAEFISENSTDYFIREKDAKEDIAIRFFGDPDGNNLIDSISINGSATPPAVSSKVLIGTKAFIINLQETQILNQRLDALGYYGNTSLSFSNNEIFSQEKFFDASKDLNINLARLRKVGDYCVDYKNGVVYLAVTTDQDLELGTADYYVAQHQAKNSNILNTLSVNKRISNSNQFENIITSYNNVNKTINDIIVLDLEAGFVRFDESLEAPDLDGVYQEVATVLEDYTVVVPYFIQNISGIYKYTDFIGENLKASNPNDRVLEKTSSSLKTSIFKDGSNIFDSSISFNKNIIDLKKRVRKRAYGSGDNYIISIKDNNVAQLHSVRRLGNQDTLLFDDKLNIAKISNVKVVDIEQSIGSVTVAIIIDDLEEIDTTNDYLLDSNGNRFKITNIDTVRSEIIVDSPAENNIEALLPSLDLTGENSSIIVKASVEITSDTLTLTIPKDSGIGSGELLEVVYLTTATPDVGTPLVIDYKYGDIYFDYNYVYDQIAVWYEYGDNELDWSINNTLEEGDEYFVSYRYGANREALRKNFGTLTQVPFFEQFPLEVDRELYRKGLQGTLQAFSKGPTIPAFKNLISSFTEIEPEISEINENSWILGRDYTYPSTVNTEGNLQFTDGKFGSGLLFDEQTSVSIPAISNISLREGTLEAWIRPDWAGINNDATLTISLDGIGEEKFNLSPVANPFDLKYGWEMAPVENIGGLIDSKNSGIKISNFKTIDGESVYGSHQNGIVRKFKYLNRITKLDAASKIKITEFGTHINRISTQGGLSLQDQNLLGCKIVVDSHRISGFNFNLDLVKNDSNEFIYTITDDDLTTDEIPNFRKPQKTKSCKCSVTNNFDKLSSFNELTIKVEFGVNYPLIDFKDSYKLLTNSSKAFVAVDDNGDIYEIKSFIDEAGNLLNNSIPDIVSGLILGRFPVNNQQIRQAKVSQMNELLPSGSLSVYCKNVTLIGSHTKNKIAFGHQSKFVVDWSEYANYRIVRSPLDNLIEYYINNNKYLGFYTETLPISDSDFNFSISEEDNKGLYFGTFNSEILSTLDIYHVIGTFYNRFDVSNIYIGKDGFNPKKKIFSINRNDADKITIGLPNNIQDDEGIFIGFDELCKSPLSEDIGQWVFRARAARTILVPIEVEISNDSYSNIFDYVNINHTFTGNITTDGEFSSVIRSTRTEDGSCSDGVICDSTFRFCGNDLLEDFGWRKLEESDSDDINLLVGGRETLSGKWRKLGDFVTNSSDGIYRIGPSLGHEELSESVLTNLPCSGGQFEYTVSLKVADYDSNLLGSDFGKFSGATSGNLTGIVPIHINEQNFNYKICLALDSFNNGLIAVIDGNTGSFIDLIRYDWHDNSFHEYRLMTDYQTESLTLYIDNLLVSRVLFGDFENSSVLENEYIGLHIFDGEMLDSISYHEVFNGNIIDIDLLYFSGFYEEGDGYLEENDVVIHTDDRIDFEFNIDEYDGYLSDAYDGYDAYGSEVKNIKVDEILISSDKLRYIIDCGVGEAEGRFSLFKDGKGFLNFRIFDNSLSESGEPGMFNIATSIKNFKAGELHHVAISWKLNSIQEQDELHLFLDGEEVPNLYRFGGKVPVRLNEKFSDVSKEVLQSFLVRDIVYPEDYTDGTVNASLSLFSSNSVTFTDEMIGRSLLVKDATLATDLIGQEFIIIGVTGGSAILGRGANLEAISFDVSDSSITFSFAPYISDILTDLRNSRFFIFKTSPNEEEEEMNGILYQVIDGEIDILSGDEIINPKYRVNVDTRLIEFVGQDESCQYVSTVAENDIDVHIKTFGLSLENIYQKINLSSSSYHSDDSNFSGYSILKLASKEPADLRDVKVKRVILDRTAIGVQNVTEDFDQTYRMSFEIDLDAKTSKVSSAEGNVAKFNSGRYLAVNIDSDNINFCHFDGYQESDITENNYIVVLGKTIDGSDQEIFPVSRNGLIEGTKLFTEVTKISGIFNIIDPDYFEAGIISLEEKDTLDIANNSGETLEISDYQNGTLILTTKGSNGEFPFELHPGFYKLEYPAYLSIRLNQIGEKIFIGSDFQKKHHFGGSIDELRIIAEKSSDTRVTEEDTSGTRSVTNDFYSPNEFCPDEQTLALIHFNNPLEVQARVLRRKEFLDSNSNMKYQLTRDQQDTLLDYINNEESFIRVMMNYGFSYDDAYKTYIEAHYAEGGPVWNEADFYKNYLPYILNENSVNSAFGHSALFIPGSYLLLDNDQGIFRKDEGTIEFWISPTVDTLFDREIRYYLDISSSRRIKIKSTTSNIIELTNPAAEILKIQLLTKKSRDKHLYQPSEINQLLFDEVSRSQISGRLEGGTGVEKDFSVGAKLSADGRKIYLADALPGTEVDLVVTYVPIGSQNDRISVFKNEHSQLVFGVTAEGIDNVIVADINWKKNTWHRVKLTYRTNSRGDDFIRVYIDGEDGGYIRYGTGIIYGTGYVYGQYIFENDKSVIDYRIPLADDLKLIAIGSDIYGDHSAYSRMDNLRFSRIVRNNTKTGNGFWIDLDYTANTNTAQPVVEDDATTFLLDFNSEGEKVNNFAKVIDPQNGIFDFKINIIDKFDKVIGINDGLVEDLIVELVNKLKPAHTNAYVKFEKSKC